MASPTWTQAQIDALHAARAAGASSVTHDGKTITWRSAAELDALIAQGTAAMAGTAPRRKRTLTSYRTGDS
jgi:hypothetical protein